MMKHLYSKIKPMKLWKVLSAIAAVFIITSAHGQQGNIIPVDASQQDFLKAYKFVFDQSDQHYRSTGAAMDKTLFPDFGEFAVYWATTGAHAGSFVYPDAMPASYSSVTSTPYSGYNLGSGNHLAVHFNKSPGRIAIFRSQVKVDETTISWEAAYFKNLFDTYLFSQVYYFIDETGMNSGSFSDSTDLLIIPAFNVKGNNYGFYADSILNRCTSFRTKIENFLSRGGTLYAEGNAASLLEKGGILGTGSLDYSNSFQPDKSGIIEINPSLHPIAGASAASGGKLFSSALPLVNIPGREDIANLKTDNRAVAFLLQGSAAKGGKIICNLALPTVAGISMAAENARQIQWAFNSILYAFAHSVDVTRSVANVLPGSIVAGRNTISYDRTDTFDVRILIRNLSDQAINNISIEENTGTYFKFLDVKTAGISASVNGHLITFGNLTLNGHSEETIEYRLVTPDPNDPVHENIDKLLDKETLIKASVAKVSYTENGCLNSYSRNKDYAGIMFSARIFADTDINWKNFLGLDYQPFKVFLTMENKERTAAENVVYTQYIPKDIPFYWTDNSINIPVLKTPGGKYVDVLRGSNDQNHPDYDMDHDGHPDVWLDTASIYPKGYSITEEEVYWANPWNHLRTGSKDIVFEDIDHDGNVARDTDGDGIVDVEEPGDKIRTWKITWNVGQMPGHQFYDPYCSLEVWVDPPDLVPLAAGVGFTQGKLKGTVPGMFYPYTPDIASANKADTTWSHWMDRDPDGNIIYKQLIYQKIDNYEGFTFIDTAATHYKMMPTDSCAGTVPQPHREFIAVLSMGGEEIDMTHPTPSQSLYSKVNYKTIFNEDRVTPIRTTYTYYAPLPNPLQFEYLSDNFTLYDSLGTKIDYLPKKGKAKIVYDIYPSTEYSYYWIRNVGHDVDYNDPSLAAEGIDKLGDGVFGYMVYDIPKGMGGYSITLPKNPDGSYNTDSLVKVDGKAFTKWIDNPHTKNEIEVWEDPFQYHVYIPQLLIPPALDDDNHDGTDDWKDDRGDRFQSKTGYLHDAFMPGNGDEYPHSPAVPFQDDIYGMVTSGWSAGSDNTYGDDKFEDLGKTHIQICANYEGKGREGNLDISKGGTVVVEEIFGGSPWVIFSHVLTGNAHGVDLSVKSTAVPSVVKFGTDTVYIKHEITDADEPHLFDANFDPYHISKGYGESSVTAIAGGKDPCSLLAQDISTSAIVDPAYDSKTITIYPNAANTAFTGGPKTLSGTFIELKVEVTNATDDNWVNTTVTPQLTGIGNSQLVMSYVAYPRPLVPNDNIGTFQAGWRFNQPENEVLVKTGNILSEIQPTRRAYFIFLLKVDPSLKKGVYSIPFTLSAGKFHYTGVSNGNVNENIPQVLFCIVSKDNNGQVKDYQKFNIDHGDLKSLVTHFTSNYSGLQKAGWSTNDINPSDFSSLKYLSVSGDGYSETIDLNKLKTLPNADTTKLYILQKGVVHLTQAGDSIDLTTGEDLHYNYNTLGEQVTHAGPVRVAPIGPIILISNKLYSVNGIPVLDTVSFQTNQEIIVGTLLKATNLGSDISQNTTITIHPGAFYQVITDSLPSNCSVVDNNIVVSLGNMIPGESKQQLLYYKIVDNGQLGDNLITVIHNSDVEYKGTSLAGTFKYTDPKEVDLFVYEFSSRQVSYQNESNTTVKVTAEAKNIGLPAHDVWFRIYPVIDGGIREFPIAEMQMDSFKTGNTISLSGDYILPAGHKIEFVAVIDDGEHFYEILENNNVKISLYSGAMAVDQLESKGVRAFTYPNPAAERVHFYYVLPEELNKVVITLVTTQGKEILKKTDATGTQGVNLQELQLEGIPAGTYFYQIKGEGNDNKTVKFTGKIIKN